MATGTLVARAAGLMLAVFGLPASAQVFKCPSGGGYTFQQAPCAGLSASGGSLLVFANGTQAPRPVPVRVAASAAESAAPRVLGRSPLPTKVTLGEPK